MQITDLMEAVIYDNYCDWNVFMENVLDAGMSKRDLAKAVNECSSKKELNKLINTFI